MYASQGRHKDLPIEGKKTEKRTEHKNSPEIETPRNIALTSEEEKGESNESKYH